MDSYPLPLFHLSLILENSSCFSGDIYIKKAYLKFAFIMTFEKERGEVYYAVSSSHCIWIHFGLSVSFLPIC